MQIVPTEYRYLSKEVLPTNQFSVTEYFSPMKEFDRTWPGWFMWFIPMFPSFLGRGGDWDGGEFLILIMSPIICSCLLLVWSVTYYCDHQRRASQFSALYHPALCSVRRYFCFNRSVSYLYFFICTKVIIWKTEGTFNPIGTSMGKKFSLKCQRTENYGMFRNF